MKKKSKLRGRNIFIDHDMTEEKREVQRKMRERTRGETEKGKRVKIGYRKIIIERKVYIWNEEEEEIREKENFGKTVMTMNQRKRRRKRSKKKAGKKQKWKTKMQVRKYQYGISQE